MNRQEQEAERQYRIDERIGIITQGQREPTPEEVKAAESEAASAVRKLTLESILKPK